MESKNQERVEPKVSLFNPNTERYNKLGLDIANEIRELLAPIFDKYYEQNISMRDLQYVIEGEVTDQVLGKILWGQEGEAE